MRKIQFRGKLSHNKEWTSGNLVMIDNIPHIVPFKNDGHGDGFEECGHHIALYRDYPTWVDVKTVGQFTGLTDRNGVEIYEGDIVEFTFFTYLWTEFEETKKGKIIFVENECSFAFESGEDIYFFNNLNFDSESEIEVIGNIHNNPELI